MRPRRVARRRATPKHPEQPAPEPSGSQQPIPAPSSASFEFVPVSEVKRTRKKPGTGPIPKALRQGVVVRAGRGPDNQYVQRETRAGAAARTSALAQLLSGPASTSSGPLQLDDDTLEFLTPAGFDDLDYDWRDPSRHQRRRVAQHARWRDEVIPQLVRPFMRTTQGMAPLPPRELCNCSGRRTASVVLAEWDATSAISLVTCRCRPLAVQLVELGYFPCAPKRPSLAFNLRLLEFISLHSLNVAPNITAWAATLEAFWARRGFVIQEKRAFRRRLGNAVHWYQVLVNRKDFRVRRALSDSRNIASGQKRERASREGSIVDVRPAKRVRFEGSGNATMTDAAAANTSDVEGGERASPPLAEAGLQRRAEMLTPSSPEPAQVEGTSTGADAEGSLDVADRGQGGSRVELHAEHADSAASSSLHQDATDPRPVNPLDSGQPSRGGSGSTPSGSTSSGAGGAGQEGRPPAGGERRKRPSEYLRQRCHLCYGGCRPELKLSDAHAIVCIDANFGQKRRKSKASDPPLFFNGSTFVPQHEVDAEEEHVASKRKQPAKRRSKGTSAALHDDVLDECESSFIAAQEKVTKASKNYYADTGLMALLCPHDNPLYIVNMTSPGERQHYALVLLRKLFDDLPDDWNVGLLYDIACQLSRSIEKFDLLGDLADRLSFAVSVFHAYGHQWACQLVFHPRKRAGFGLSDGEGCERFWSAIRKLIPCLRVSGYYRRLFLLDRQIDHIRQQNTFKFGRWLGRRWMDAQRRLGEATSQLTLCGVSEAELDRQWKAQIAAQVQSGPRQSKHAGDKALDKMLLDLALVDEYQAQLREDRSTLRRSAHKMTAPEVQALTDRIERTGGDIKAARARVELAKSQLGTGALQKFESLRGDAYIRARVNARAVRVQIRMAIQAHKFEREKLERNYRRHVMQNKDHAQVRDLVNSREKNLSAMVRKFNALVTQMEALVHDSRAPRRRMQLPRRLDAKKLFRLDVDDEIWQEDPGLGPQDEGELPRWQVDESVRRGIRVLLEVRCCREELERVEVEARNLSLWWTEEYALVSDYCRTETDQLLANEAKALRAKLEAYAVEWNSELIVSGLPVRFNSSAPTAPPPSSAVEPPASHAPVGSPSPMEDEENDDAVSLWSSDSGFSEDDADFDLVDLISGEVEDVDSSEDDTVLDTPAAHSSSPPARARTTSPVPAQALGVQTARKVSPSAVSISSSEDERAHTAAPRRERGRVCGPFQCDADDIARMASRTAWLSGTGLAVFAESHVRAAGNPAIGHLPSTLFVDVADYCEAVKKHDSEREAANREWIWSKVKRQPPPAVATKWLITVHILSPQHWTLVEIRWKARELRFYDSQASLNDYDLEVKRLAFALLKICEDLYQCDLHTGDWSWVGEQRGIRQRNWYDCGPFVAADFVSLVTSDLPSAIKEEDMKQWRKEMAAHVRSLKVVSKPPKSDPLTQEQLDGAIVISD